MDKFWTKEDVHDEQISPLMSQIIAICKEADRAHGEGFASRFGLDGTHYYQRVAVSPIDPFGKEST